MESIRFLVINTFCMLLVIVIAVASTSKPGNPKSTQEHFNDENATITNSNVCIKKSCMGDRGAFATRDIKAGEIIETCPAIIDNNWDKLSETEIGNYLFSSEKSESVKVMALGYCALFNHDDNLYNVYWEIDSDNKVVVFKALDDIKKDQEMFVNYGPDYWTTRNIKPKSCKI